MKHVTFTPDTRFGPSRPNYRYSRSASSYRAGIFSASTEKGFRDTSFLSDKFFDCSQLKVFTGSPEEVDALLETSGQPPRNEGLVAHHRLGKDILAHLKYFYKRDKKAFVEGLKDVDWVLLAMQDGQPVNFSVLDTRDTEDPGTVYAVHNPEETVSSAQSTAVFPPEEHRTPPTPTDRTQTSPQADLQDTRAIVAPGEPHVSIGSSEGIQLSHASSLHFVSGVSGNGHAEHASATASQPSKPALKSCLKKRPIGKHVTPNAPRRSRWD